MRRIEVCQEGRSWAVKHNGGYLGFADSREEASQLAEALDDRFATKPRWPAKTLARVSPTVRTDPDPHRERPGDAHRESRAPGD